MTNKDNRGVSSFSTLADMVVVNVTGEDAYHFLQAQFTNDLSPIRQQCSQLSAYCNPKGRLLATFRVISYDDGFRLIVPSDVADAFIKRLKIYVMRAKVSIALDDELRCWGLTLHQSTNSSAANEPVLSLLPELDSLQGADATSSGDNYVLVNIDTGGSRIFMISLGDKAQHIVDELRNRLLTDNGRIWYSHDIQSGLPHIFSATAEQFVPQDVNLDLTNAVSFSKGCYPGQEIVARLHYRGKAKNRMFYAKVTTTKSPTPGTPLFQADRTLQKSGQVVNVQPMDKAGDYMLLGVAAYQQNTFPILYCGASDGPLVEFQTLPYSLEPPSLQTITS